MNTYKITMDDGRRIDVKAHNAADAMQSALTKHLGHRVAECFQGSRDARFGGFIGYEIPRHDPVMEKTVREKKVHPPEDDANKALREKHAPWIEDWMKQTNQVVK